MLADVSNLSSSSKNNNNNIVSETTDLDTYSGIILEPTIEFLTFILDAVMSVFSNLMTQNDAGFVMTFKGNIKNLPGEVGVTYTIPDASAYTLVDELLRYPNFTYSPEEIFSGNLDLLDINFISSSNKDQNWLNLRTVVSQWYQILRMIAIIGLLSVLIYTGIKIIISSNAKDKAKYKEMLVNWFVGVILVFAMHYIMAFILTVIEEITNLLKQTTGVIQVSIEGVTFKTNLIGLARFQMQQLSFRAKVGYLIIYTALVVYTFKFTFVYIKRVLKMAFLTLIAPIVALTYPIDKANDGNAQGFQMWLKEFTFNALLQPMHYILYYILISSSLSLAVRNPLYGIVALGFMSQAEKLLKKIFGFDKARAGTVGGIAGAFATGAVTSSLMNYVKNPLHPFGGGSGDGKNNESTESQSANGQNNYNFNEEGINFNEDTTTMEDLVNMNLRGTRIGNNNVLNQENEDTSFELESLRSRDDMLQMIADYEGNGGNLDNIPDLSTLSDDELRDLIQEKGINNYGDLSGLTQRGEMNNPNSLNNNIFFPQNTNPSLETEHEKQQGSAWSRFKQRHPTARGLANVGRTLAKPVWDMDKGAKYNGERLAGNILKATAGATVGVAAAAVQAGISITDGNYNPMEGVATIGAGIAGVSAITGNTEKRKEIDPEDENRLKKYSEQWFNDDNVIKSYNKEFPGQGKEMRNRAVRNYVSRGITDVSEQKKAIKFAELIKKERGLDEDEADKIAVATLQYKQELTRNNNYDIIFNKEKRKSYIDSHVEAYSGALSKDSIRRVHEDCIENVKDFDRANR